MLDMDLNNPYIKIEDENISKIHRFWKSNKNYW